MFCTNCGAALADGTRFCPSCGAAVPQERQAVQQPPRQQEPDGRVQMGVDGAYHWLYCMDVRRHARWFWLAVKITAACFLALALVSSVVSLAQGEFSAEDLIGPLLAGVIMTVILLISWGIYLLASGGEYWCVFTMDGRGVTQRSMDKTYDRMQALGALAFVMANSPGARSAAATGMRGAAWHMNFSDVRTIVIDREHDMIGLKDRVFMSSVYVSPEDYAFVLDYIKASVPRDAAISEKE